MMTIRHRKTLARRRQFLADGACVWLNPMADISSFAIHTGSKKAAYTGIATSFANGRSSSREKQPRAKMPSERTYGAKDGWFPILTDYSRKDQEAMRHAGSPYLVVCAPWAMMAAHERQAESNHGHTIQRLAERGGLSPCEALAVIEDRRWTRLPVDEANEKLRAAIEVWLARDAAAEGKAK